jgi:exodeoxyribonuclease VII large subunit
VRQQNAVNEIINALDKVYSLNGIDTVIIGRGGGSNEDLDAFNSELLARKFFESPFPVISAVGHETDITICDLVADLRAPTPSAAAELAVPDIMQITRKIELLNENISNLCQSKIDLCYSKLKALSPLFSLEKFSFFIENNALSLDLLSEKISHLYKNNVNVSVNKFGELTARIEALNPLKILSRGYGVVCKNNKTVTTVNDVNNGDMLNIKLSDGEIDCTVIDRR